MLDGKIGEPVTPEDAARPHAFAAKIGPFAAVPRKSIGYFETVGLTVEVPHDGAARRHCAGGLTGSFSACSWGHALTARDNELKLYVDSLVDSLIEMGRGWLGKCPEADLVIFRGWPAIESRWLRGFAPGWRTRKRASGRRRTPERKIRLHDRRHATILTGQLTGAGSRGRIVDLGCGDGSLTAQLLRSFPMEVVGVEAGGVFIRRPEASTRSGSSADDNLMALYLEKTDLEPDVMVMSEVIEHLIADDRGNRHAPNRPHVAPSTVVLTAQHRKYNPVFGMPPACFTTGTTRSNTRRRICGAKSSSRWRMAATRFRRPGAGAASMKSCSRASWFWPFGGELRRPPIATCGGRARRALR